MYNIVYDVAYDIRYDIVYDMKTYIYLWYVIGLDLTPVVQMFPPCCFNLCFDCFCVPIRKGFICSVQFIVGTSTNRTLPCVTHGCRCHLRTVQNKQVVECSAQAYEVVSKTEVYILWTQFVQVCNNVIHGAMVEIKPPFSQPILVRLGTGWCLQNRL